LGFSLSHLLCRHSLCRHLLSQSLLVLDLQLTMVRREWMMTRIPDYTRLRWRCHFWAFRTHRRSFILLLPLHGLVGHLPLQLNRLLLLQTPRYLLMYCRHKLRVFINYCS
jgi:hypothetical protein